MKIDSGLLSAATEWRRHLHSIPELGFQEHQTSSFVAERLKAAGLDVHTGIGGTGIVGILRRGQGNRAIAVRADMDALKIAEVAGLPYASTHPGQMHACGHDGHTAMLLGAASYLAAGEAFSGTAVFIFQPNEEHGRGARAMIEDGVLDRFPFEEIYGLHNAPGLPVGTFASRSGAIMAAEDNFEIRIHGKGGHAARPQTANDPLVVGAQIVLALQSILSRRVSALDSAVVSVTEFITDGTRNVLPGNVVLRGDARAYSSTVQQLIEREMRNMCTGVAAAFGAAVEVDYSHEFAATLNHDEPTQHALGAARQTFGDANVDDALEPFMGSEDFGVFLQHRPGNFAFIGNGLEGRCGQPLHNAEYDFNDAAIEQGIAYWVNLVAARLPR